MSIQYLLFRLARKTVVLWTTWTWRWSLPVIDPLIISISRYLLHPTISKNRAENPFLDRYPLPEAAEEYFRELVVDPSGILNTRWKMGSAFSSDGMPFLYVLVRLLKPDYILEIGRFKGRSLTQMCLALSRNGTGTVMSIDPTLIDGMEPDKEFCKPVAVMLPESRYVPEHLGKQIVMHRDRMEIIVGYSNEDSVIEYVDRKMGGSCSLMFIDGDHSYEGVKSDFLNYVKMLSTGGYVLFDNAAETKHGVAKLIEEIAGGTYDHVGKFVGVKLVYKKLFDYEGDGIALRKL